jgi:hypothetical protein
MKLSARITMNKLAPLLAATAFTASTPCFATVLSQPQAQVIGANIVGAEATANSAVGPAAVPLLAQAFNEIGNGVNTMVNDLSTRLSPAQAATIKGSVTVAQSLASQASTLGDAGGRQILATSFNKLGDAINQLASGVNQAFGQRFQGMVTEVNGIVSQDEALFFPAAATGINTPDLNSTMALATSRLALSGLGVMVNILDSSN